MSKYDIMIYVYVEEKINYFVRKNIITNIQESVLLKVKYNTRIRNKS